MRPGPHTSTSWSSSGPLNLMTIKIFKAICVHTHTEYCRLKWSEVPGQGMSTWLFRRPAYCDRTQDSKIIIFTSLLHSGQHFYNMTRNDLSQAQHLTFRQIILYIPYTLTGQFLKSYATGPVVLWIFPSIQSKHKIGKWKSMIILNTVLTTKLVWVTVPIL